ncbi:MAG TPA: hypothetical protein VGJ20_35875 [Xanthobacteraceae bacterium]
MIVSQDSQIELIATRTGHHRVRLDHGEITARIWAPPGAFGVQTSVANAIDVGCEFTLSMTVAGSGLLRVTHGWVELQNDGLQSLIPEGADAQLDPKWGPGTPFDDHASAEFQSALKALDTLGPSIAASNPAIAQLVGASRSQDAITLISLLTRYPQLADTAIYDRAISVLPPPEGLTAAAVRNRDQALLEAWWHRLPYPRVKSWWMRWPDIFESTPEHISPQSAATGDR